MKRALLFLAVGWAVVFATLVGYVDFDAQMRPLIQISDYLMTFHVAGYVVGHGQLAILYPPADAATFAGMPFDKMAHLLLPQMPASSVAEFMYMPLAAAVFIPLSLAPLNWSLLLWQVISLLAIFLSVQLVWLTRTGNTGKGELLIRLLPSLWLLPVCLTLWIGQVGLVFGVLPLAAGYFALCRRRPYLAGLLWSLAVLKPQFLVPVFVTLFALLLRKNAKPVWGMLAGFSMIAAVSLIVFPFSLNIDWLHCLKVSDAVYSNPKSGIATHIATSLPRTLILMAPATSQAVIKIAAYALSGLLLLSALAGNWLLQRSGRWTEEEALRLSLLIGMFVTPLVMPHFFLYDYAMFCLAVPLVFFSTWSGRSGWLLKRFVVVAWSVMNIYSVVVLGAHKLAVPLIFMLAILGLYVYLLVLTCRQEKQSA